MATILDTTAVTKVIQETFTGKWNQRRGSGGRNSDTKISKYLELGKTFTSPRPQTHSFYTDE